jgi:hypothetical protein
VKDIIGRTEERAAIQSVMSMWLGKKVPTAAALLSVAGEKIVFPWRSRIVKIIGLRWNKCSSKCRILIENQEIVLWHHKYLVQMMRLQVEGKEIFYVDKSWVDNNITFSREGEFGIKKSYSAGNTLILLHSGSENSFLDNMMLVCKTGSERGDYHRQINGTNIEKWFHENLASKLPYACVFVLDNAPHHTVPLDTVPSKDAVKRDI